MTTQVTLGNFFSVNGKNVLGGAGGSGLDTQAIINELTTVKNQPAVNDQAQITANGKISSALTQFQSLLSTFQSAAGALSNPPGIGNQANNAFDFTTANVTASDGSTAGNYVSVTTSPGAATQTYTINSIQQLATAASQSTGVLNATSANAAFAGVGNQIQPGTIIPQQTLAVSSLESGTTGSSTITVSVNSVANLTVGQQITLAGTGGSLDGISGLNAPQTITSINTANNTFTFSGTGTAALGNQSSTEGGGATVTNGATLAISSFESGNIGTGTVTATVNSVAGLQLGQQIMVNGATGALDGGIAAGDINGVQTITSINTTDNTFTFSTAGVAGSGNQSSTEGGGASAVSSNVPSITINAGDSLNTIAADFNAVSTQTGIGATVIQLSSGKFELSFTSTNTGTDSDFDLTSTNVDFGNTVFNAGLSPAVTGQNAVFYLNGISTPIERQSNTISDVVNGVTFNLSGAFNTSYDPPSDTSGPTLNIAIQPDTTTIQNSIVNFVNAYNAIQTFAAQQTQLTSSGTYASSAVLATNETFRQTMSDINQEITGQVLGLSGTITSLADIGITLTNQPATSTTPEVTNILNVNDGELSSALATNFSGVENLFGLNMTSNNPNLAIFSVTNAVTASNFTLNIDPGSSTYTATLGNGDVINLTATALPTGSTGYFLTGPAESPLAGLQMIYASTNPSTSNVTITQGIADTANNTSNAATTANTGTIAVALTGIQTVNTTLNNDIANVKTQVSQYQQQLLKQYSQLESAVSTVNSSLDYLSANSAAQLEAAQLP